MGTNTRTNSYPSQELIVSFYSSMIELMVTTDEKQAFSDRFNAILDKAGIPPKGKGRQGALAKIFGVSDKGARKWIEAEAIPSTTKLPHIVEEFKDTGVTVEWLLTGNPAYSPDLIKESRTAIKTGSSNKEPNYVLGGFDLWDDETPLGPDDVALPFFREVELSAGNGWYEVIENHGRKLRFSKSTLKSMGIDLSRAACVTVSGDSMEPVLRDGTTVGIDKGMTRIVDKEMYAIDYDGCLRVKALYNMPGGGIRIRSYNVDEYPDQILSKEETDKHIKIIGWVFWWSTLAKRR